MNKTIAAKSEAGARIWNRRCALAVLTAFMAATPVAASADLSYTLQDHPAKGPMLPSVSAHVSFQGQFERVDSSIGYNGASVHIVNIVEAGGAGKQYTYDPGLKIYTVEDVSGIEPELFGIGTLIAGYAPGGEGLMLPLPLAAQRTGPTTVAVIDRGAGKIGRTAAHCWSIALSAPAGAAQTEPPVRSFDVWTDDDQPQPVDAAMAGALAGTEYYGGDLAALKSVLSAQPVRIEATLAPAQGQAGAGFVETYDVQKVSTVSLPAALFALPANLKLVTPDEFVSEEVKTMMARLAGAPEHPGEVFSPTAVHPRSPNGGDGVEFPGQAPEAPSLPNAP